MDFVTRVAAVAVADLDAATDFHCRLVDRGRGQVQTQDPSGNLLTLVEPA